jgi:hypothetical protein
MRIRSGPAGRPTPPVQASNTPPRRPPAGRTFIAVLGDRALNVSAPPAPTAPRSAPAARRAPPATAVSAPSGPVRSLVQGTLDGERRVDTLLAAAARGKTFSPSELLALQATVFRYSQAVEVVSRASDKLVGAVKQALGTQV